MYITGENIMDITPEERFARAYIRKSRRERVLYELTTPGKRARGLDRFCHGTPELIDPAKVLLAGGDLVRQPDFARFVRKHEGDCDILSPDPGLDGLRLSLADAVNLAFYCLDAVIILGDGFALVFGEAEKGGRDQFLLSEK